MTIDPTHLYRLEGHYRPDLAGCDACSAHGHLCRPCRKVRYESRHVDQTQKRLFIAALAALFVAAFFIGASI